MGRSRFALVLLAFAAACAPATPRIDGVPGAPPSPAQSWPVPAQVQPARSSTNTAATTDASDTTNALLADSNGPSSALALSDVIDLALRRNPATRESWAAARAAVDTYGATRGALFMPRLDANVDAGRSNNATTNGTSLGADGIPGNPEP